jgi:cysteine desulfurase / selenocysteine lyase
LTLALNGAQALGQLPIDVAASGAAFFAAPSHKWFMAGYGTGLLFIRRDWLTTVPLPMAGWLSVAPHEQFQPWVHATRVDDATGFVATGMKSRQEASALEVGGGPWVGLHAVDAALALHEAVGQPQVLAHNLELQLRLRGRLRSLGFTPTTPDDAATLSGICVVPVQGEPLEAVRALVRAHRVMTTARGGGLRISTHGYNTEEDLERFFHAVARLGLKPR